MALHAGVAVFEGRCENKTNDEVGYDGCNYNMKWID